MATSPPDPGLLAAVLAGLRERGLLLATAESLTGGRLAAAITSVPGASSVYRGGYITYATEAKVEVLGVPARLIAEYGAVSSQCAVAMATGARRLLRADVALATTGVAGPDEQEGKPVGRVHVACDYRGVPSVVQLDLAGAGDRGAIQDATLAGAWELLLGLLRQG